MAVGVFGVFDRILYTIDNMSIISGDHDHNILQTGWNSIDINENSFSQSVVIQKSILLPLVDVDLSRGKK